MPETDPRQAAMDELLRRSMAGPTPSLSADFHPRLAQTLRRRSETTLPLARLLIGAYGAVSTLVSVVVMRGQGLGFDMVAGALFGAALLLGGIRVAMRRPPTLAARH